MNTSLLLIIIQRAGQQRRTQPVLRHLLLPRCLETDQDIPEPRVAVIFVITLSSGVASRCMIFYSSCCIWSTLRRSYSFWSSPALCRIVEMFLKKTSPAIYNALGIYLPLITTNCAVLGVALTNVQDGYNFIQSVTAGFGTAIGYTISIVLLAGIRDRIDEASVPRPFRGAPVVLLSAALMSIAFMGFAGLSL